MRGGRNTYAYVKASPLKYKDLLGLRWYVGEALNENDTLNRNGCDDEEPAVFLSKSNQSTCVTVIECIRVHERSHINDALRENPNICKGNRGRRIFKITGDSQVDVDRQAFQSELDAFYEQLKCLTAGLGKSCSCTNEIKNNIDLIENDYKKRIFRGTYPD